MVQLTVFLSLTVFTIGSYLVWPSRYNITAHLGLPFVFIAYFVPSIILNDYGDYQSDIVSLYAELLAVGAGCYLLGMFIGFRIKTHQTAFSFDVLDTKTYERNIIKITKVLFICGILGEILGYLLMGFVPMFAADPFAAKFFRGVYQVPFYVSIVYLSSFFILSTITPIGLVIWYRNRKKIFFLIAAIISVSLMMLSLSRSPAFSGIVLAIAIIMSLKGKVSFSLLIVFLFAVYIFSSVFYFIAGIKNIAEASLNFKDDHIFWRVLSSGTIDISDQLNFLTYFQNKPEWTYGRTIFGGLVPSHYYWNPSVFTLRVVNPDEDLSTLISGGLRLPAPIWGYVSFQWPGVVLFCFISGLFKGAIVKYTKFWILKHKSMLTITIIIVINVTVFELLHTFYSLSIYSIPPIFVLLFYMYRFKLKQ